MITPPVITEGGVPYDTQDAMRKHNSAPVSDESTTSTRMPRLARVLRWLENYSPPKVLLTVFADAQIEKRRKLFGVRKKRKAKNSASEIQSSGS